MPFPRLVAPPDDSVDDGGGVFRSGCSLPTASSALTSFLRILRPGHQTLSCKATARDVRFTGVLARVFCPLRCLEDPRPKVFGVGVHPMNSSVCMSAVVDRVLPPDGGEIVLARVPGPRNYSGASVEFEVETETPGKIAKPIFSSMPAEGVSGAAFVSYGSNTGDQATALPAEKEVSCSDTFASLAIAGVGKSQPVMCPDSCRGAGDLFGTGAYKSNSSVCRAAEHAGLISEDGGHVIVTRAQGQSRFYGRKSFFDTSQDAPGDGDSYVVSLPTADVLARVRREPVAKFL